MWRRLVVSYGALFVCSLLVLAALVYGAVMLHLLTQQQTAQLMQAQIMSTGLSRLSASEQERSLTALRQQFPGRLLLLDQSGAVSFDTFASYVKGTDMSSYPEVAQALAGKPAANHYRGKGLWAMQAAVPVWQGREVAGVLLYVQSLQPLSQNLRQLAWLLISSGLLVLLLTFVVSGAVAGRITRPLKRLDTAVQALTRGEAHQRLSAIGRDELATLTRNFNLMAERLQQLERQRRQFLSDAAHELRTPLASLQALLEPLAEGAVSLPTEQYREFLCDALAELGRLHRLVEELLQQSRLEGTVQLQKTTLDPSQLVHSVLRLLAGAADVADVQLVHRSLEQPLRLMADGEKLKQVVVNLVDNGIKHSPPGSAITVTEALTATDYLLVVADQGSGIDPDDLPHIFERFYRGDKARRRRSGGSGLGLAIASRIAELHAGSITAESELGKGSRFTLRLPRQDSLEL
jgi:two-component system OmpR family sensor kinase